MFCTKCGEMIPDNSELCPKCGIPLAEEVPAVACETAQPEEPAVVYATAEPEARVCSKCGSDLEEEQVFCSKCGAPADGKIKCVKCGAELNEGQEFCPKCGQKVSTVKSMVSDTVSQLESKIKTTGQGKKKPIIIGAVAVVAVIVILVVIFGGNSGSKFQDIYEEYCSPIWATVGSDGSYLSIDTNPYDEDDNGIAYYAAYIAIEDVNSALGLPDSLIEAMGRTTGADGKQTETYDKIVVTWKYHPDKGLEVTYSKVK